MLLDKKKVSRSPKTLNLYAKIAQSWQIVVFNYFCLLQLFAPNSIAFNNFFLNLKFLKYSDHQVET